MAKTINVVDLEKNDPARGNTPLYQVKSTKNTTRFKINEVITEIDVNDLIVAGYEVNIKEKKEDKD